MTLNLTKKSEIENYKEKEMKRNVIPMFFPSFP